MRKYYESFIFFNGHLHSENFIQIYIFLHLPFIYLGHKHIAFYYIEAFQPISLISAINIDYYFSKFATIYCIAFWHILHVNNIKPTLLNQKIQSM